MACIHCVLLGSLIASIKLITKSFFFILYMTQFSVTTQPNVNVSYYFNPPENTAHIKEEVTKRQTDMHGISKEFLAFKTNIFGE